MSSKSKVTAGRNFIQNFIQNLAQKSLSDKFFGDPENKFDQKELDRIKQSPEEFLQKMNRSLDQKSDGETDEDTKITDIFNKFRLKTIYKVLVEVKSDYILIAHQNKKQIVQFFMGAYNSYPNHVKIDIVRQMEKNVLLREDIEILEKISVFIFIDFLRDTIFESKIEKINNSFRSFLFLEHLYLNTNVINIGFVCDKNVYIFSQLDRDNYIFTSNDKNFKDSVFSTNYIRERYVLKKYENAIKSEIDGEIENELKTEDDFFYELYTCIMEHFRLIDMKQLTFYYTLEDGFKVTYLMEDL